jgi:hypothetical protein
MRHVVAPRLIDFVFAAFEENLAGGEPRSRGFGFGVKAGQVIGREFDIRVKDRDPVAARLRDAPVHGFRKTRVAAHLDYAGATIASRLRRSVQRSIVDHEDFVRPQCLPD